MLFSTHCALGLALLGQDPGPAGSDERTLLTLAVLAGRPPAVKQLVSGALHSCVLWDNGTVRCWGESRFGQLGYGNTNSIGDNEPASSGGDVQLGGPVVQLSAGFFNTCALLHSGEVRCFGRHTATAPGGPDHVGDNELPNSVAPIDIGGTVTQITSGGVHNCALLSTGAVRCWGDGANGVLGYGNTNFVSSPAQAGDVNVGGQVARIDAGTNGTCALLTGGTVRCWGDGFSGQPGYLNANDVGDDETPAAVGDVNVGGTVKDIQVGHFHTCALLDGGAVRCWGYGLNGRLGYANTNTIGDDETPASAGNVDLGGTTVHLNAGIHHTCVILDGGAVRCWGWGDTGRPGYGNTNNIGDNETPASAGNVDLGAAAVQVALGQGHTCALLADGRVRCWGRNAEGQLGVGNTTVIGDDETPASGGFVSLF